VAANVRAHPLASDNRLQAKHYLLAIAGGVPLLYISVVTLSQPFIPSDQLVNFANLVLLPILLAILVYLGFIRKQDGGRTGFQIRVVAESKNKATICLKAAHLLFGMAFVAWVFSEGVIFYSVWPNGWFARSSFRSRIDVRTVKPHPSSLFRNVIVITMRIPPKETDFDIYWPAQRSEEIPVNVNPNFKYAICLAGKESFLGKSVDHLLSASSCP
jgi:hypothetical protein